MTPDERAQIRGLHERWEHGDGVPDSPYEVDCYECGDRWPCAAVRLLDELERSEEEAGVFMSERDHAESEGDALRAALRQIADYDSHHTFAWRTARRALDASVGLPEGKPRDVRD